jgi:hypothetical protein
MSADTYSLIRKAIVNKEQVIATYDGRVREMCPHVLGTKAGRPQALFYQFGGFSRSGLGPPGSPDNWRCLPLERLSDVRVRPGQWHTAAIYRRPHQLCVDSVDVVVELFGPPLLEPQ